MFTISYTGLALMPRAVDWRIGSFGLDVGLSNQTSRASDLDEQSRPSTPDAASRARRWLTPSPTPYPITSFRQLRTNKNFGAKSLSRRHWDGASRRAGQRTSNAGPAQPFLLPKLTLSSKFSFDSDVKRIATRPSKSSIRITRTRQQESRVSSTYQRGVKFCRNRMFLGVLPSVVGSERATHLCIWGGARGTMRGGG